MSRLINGSDAPRRKSFRRTWASIGQAWSRFLPRSWQSCSLSISKTYFESSIMLEPPDRAAHLSEINQSAFRRDRDRLSSANRIQLFQNDLHVAFHRELTD